ncbi:MerR family transcriptional regulator [Nocardioides phosphati]|jgi:DNA-binding transcriptional MerR regulator|uniref:MerR family transcriptional regulator n=1 Tax=Nocardioides phosphati TaxID=1867775 RepID=A0ABQ2NDZ5_9ACTN|nr:MerR family transcriptional regulator [Nocardioides phosphati]GGO94344.1 MerR family transcriptional regulator [Nocardioides phosphati]
MRPATAAQLRNVEAVLESLRRGQRSLARNPRASIERAVKQLLSGNGGKAATHTEERSGAYRIDDIARITATTVRNVRAYQERGLLHPPRRQGRTAFFDDSHVTRLKLINSMLDRGYNSGHIREMLDAWEHGKSLGDVMGIEQALTPAPHDPPTMMGLVAARELAGGAVDLERFVEAGLVELKGNRVHMLRPQLLASFAEMRTYGMSTESLLKLHHDVVPLVDDITQRLVAAGVAHLSHFFDFETAQTSTDVSELVTMLIRFRALATASVTATLDSSIERTVEDLLTEYLATFVTDVSADVS